MATFRTRARAVDLLGKQQIRDEVTAISELLRNSYDADANYGTIDVNTKQNQIIISDDGEGMTRKDIEEKWLTLGTHSKTNNIKKTRKGRVKIGEKGIGRLAISLLGDQLLLISKKEKEWSILYLHWELFRNEHMFLEDIELPIKSFDTFEELKVFIDNKFNEFKTHLLKNFNNKEIWSDKIILKVTQQIEDFKITNKVLSEIYKVNQSKNGTIFHISNLEYTWSWDSYISGTKEKSMLRRHKRLIGTLYSFENPIAKFDNEVEEKKISFEPSIIINGVNLNDQTWFNEDDIHLYDYSVKGIINNGKFSGVCKIKHSEEEIEEIPFENKELTQGIEYKIGKDCGPLSINWYFVEGNKSNSALDKDSHKKITKKLDEIGGIFVFRDGLRILPYGEPGNDFLELEAIRSKRASDFPFSFRRMFGYIEITKELNGKLLDKSSREGFIENQYYHYFKDVTLNMLEWWAYEFLETKDKDSGRRRERLEKFAVERQLREAQKEEEKNQEIYLLNLQKNVQSVHANLKKTVRTIEKSFNDELIRFRNNLNPTKINFRSYLREKIIKLKLHHREIIKKLENLIITPNLRYTIPSNIMGIIKENNSEIKREITRLETYFQKIIIEEELIILKKYENNLKSEEETIIDTLDQINTLKSDVEDTSKIIKRFKEDYEKNIAIDLKKITNKIFDEYTDNLRKEFKSIEEENQELTLKLSELEPLYNQLKSADLSADSALLIEKIRNIVNLIQMQKFSIHEKTLLVKNDILSKEFHIKAKNMIENFNNIIKNNDYTDDQLIGILKKEVDMYRDISAVGLAAELTSHEFNALYQEIKRNYKILDLKLKNTSLLPVLQKSNRAFRSLERLHERMSPLYRQSRNIKSEINLKKFIGTLVEYFSTDLKRYDIQIINEIPEDVIIKEVEAVLFTPLINIISNSIYWLLNQEKREIHFYMDYNMTKLYVQDTGPGIKPIDIPYIFEPYFTKKVGGRGLGLFLSRDILEHNGHQFFAIDPNNFLTELSGACFCIEFNSKVVLTGGKSK
ncbi:ATP-binding protein [Exiguobacterium sp. s39]|uniref:ATP-binding protein n=1 Tax=Exiguobacterium sp. s39 TaxID=2751198 RepID=UPI001BE663D2|nr:ATP-binding protein [Exiguobacterium sp. s39]